MVDNNALLIDKVSNGNSSNVSNVDNAISNVSNVGNASKVSCVDNISNIDNTNVSAGNVGAGCFNSGVPLFGQLMVLHQIPPPSSGDSDMMPASGPRKCPALESPLEDSSAPPGLAPRPVDKEAGNSKVFKKNLCGRGHHSLPGSVSLAAEKASSRGRPPH